MRYILLIYGDEVSWANRPPDELEKEMQEYYDYGSWLTETGWMRGGDALEPTRQATTVRVRGEETLTSDGPFAETKEQLGGFYVVECSNLDEAIEAAKRIPGARNGSIEIRPIMEFPDQEDHPSS
jgi:hypothetical protein